MAEEPLIEVIFDRLLEVLHQTPDDLAEARRVATQLAGQLAETPFRLEGGFEQAGMVHEMTLRGRMLVRGVGAIALLAGASPEDLIAVARTLASDDSPVESSGGVEVSPAPEGTEMPGLIPEQFETEPQFRFLEDEGEGLGREGHRSSTPLSDEMSQLSRAITDAAARRSWTEVVHAAEVLVAHSRRVQQDTRRRATLLVRQVISTEMVAGLIEHAIQAPEDQARTARILGYLGPSAAEVVIDALAESGPVAAKRFLMDAVVSMPQASSMAIGLLRSDEPREIALGAELISLMTPPIPGALKELIRRSGHPQSRVRAAVYRALGSLGSEGAAAVRRGLADTDAAARGDAVRVVILLEGDAGVMAVERSLNEAPRKARIATVEALGEAASDEAARALGRVACRGRRLTGGGFDRDTRLAAVRALGGSSARARDTVLATIAKQTRGAVGQAARSALRD